MIFPSSRSDEEPSRKVQVSLISDENDTSTIHLKIFSTSEEEETWIQHAACRLHIRESPPTPVQDTLFQPQTEELSKIDLTSYYDSKNHLGISLGPAFRTLDELHYGSSEAVATISTGVTDNRTPLHPLLLDGCFQVMSAACRELLDRSDTPYLPFGWERLTLETALPERIVCRARLRNESDSSQSAQTPNTLPEILIGDLDLYDLDGRAIGYITGFVTKRATRSALVSVMSNESDLHYEVVWREVDPVMGMLPADFLTTPTVAEERSQPFSKYLEAIGVEYESHLAALTDLQKLTNAFSLSALENLGWHREVDEEFDAATLQRDLGVISAHTRLFHRILKHLTHAGLLEEKGGQYRVVVPHGERLPDSIPTDRQQYATEMLSKYEHSSLEIRFFLRCVRLLDQVLVGNEDPLHVLFGDQEPSLVDLYSKSSAARSANSALADAVSISLQNFKNHRPLRILEIGAGTGSATESVIPCLSDFSCEYVFTDISAAFFTDAKARFTGDALSIEYRVLNIEEDPLAQGFSAHSYDLILASNVLHATRKLDETLSHCLKLLAPSGQLLLLEIFLTTGWRDLTFGQLDGWWRFDDSYRIHTPLLTPEVWKRALLDAGFVNIGLFGHEPHHPPLPWNHRRWGTR